MLLRKHVGPEVNNDNFIVPDPRPLRRERETEATAMDAAESELGENALRISNE